MKILKYIYLEDNDIRIGYMENSELGYVTKEIDQLESGDQTTINIFKLMFENYGLSAEKIYSNTGQFDIEKIMWWVDNNKPKTMYSEAFPIIMSEDELTKYSEYKSLCETLMNE